MKGKDQKKKRTSPTSLKEIEKRDFKAREKSAQKYFDNFIKKTKDKTTFSFGQFFNTYLTSKKI